LKQEFLVYTVPGSDLKFLNCRPLTSGVWGFGMNYFYTPKDLERRSGLYESDPQAPISPVEGKFKAYDLALSASYGFTWNDKLDLGSTLKYIRQAIDDQAAGSAALDLGALYGFDLGDRRFTAGLAVLNLGPGIKFTDRRYDLPLTFRAGLSHKVYGTGMVLDADVSKPIDNYPSLALGVELPLSSKFFLRSGYRYRLNGNELGAWSGFAAGIGFNIARFSFDYAFSPFGELGNTHRFSLSMKFAGPGKPALREAGEPVPPAESIINSRLAEYEVKSRALMISPRGARYEIAAKSGASALYSIKFRTLLRGAAAVSISVAEGGLPRPLQSRLPEGVEPVLAWQFSSNLGNIQGNIAFEFKIPKDAAVKTDYSFLYLARNGWQEVEAVRLREEDGYIYFSAAAPFSTHYAAAPKYY
jgi:hypothetical protein